VRAYLFAAALVAAFFMPAAEANDLTLPDPELTPGVTRDLTKKEICSTIWSRDRRMVSAAMKREVFERYSLTPNDRSCKKGKHKSRFEMDHAIPRCAGGADKIENLWAQCYSGKWNATMKDRLEVRVCKDLCSGALKLEKVPAIFIPDWRVGYRKYFGEP
jgi:hypothetical protein